MDIIKIWVFYFRDFLVRNFMVNPKALLYNDELFYFNGIKLLLYYLFRLLPFCFIKTLLGLFNIRIIYKLDSIYNLSNIQHNHIVPIILQFVFEAELTEITYEKDFTTIIKYYNSTIPLQFIITENNLKDYKKIKLKYFNKEKIVDKLVNINNFIKLPIYKLFEN